MVKVIWHTTHLHTYICKYLCVCGEMPEKGNFWSCACQNAPVHIERAKRSGIQNQNKSFMRKVKVVFALIKRGNIISSARQMKMVRSWAAPEPTSLSLSHCITATTLRSPHIAGNAGRDEPGSLLLPHLISHLYVDLVSFKETFSGGLVLTDR